MDLITNLFTNLAFPIALAVWLLWRDAKARESAQKDKERLEDLLNKAQETLHQTQDQFASSLLEMHTTMVKTIDRNDRTHKEGHRVLREVCEALRTRPCLTPETGSHPRSEYRRTRSQEIPEVPVEEGSDRISRP